MFGSLGGAEILFILILALLIFGPRKLPQIGRTIGKAMAEFRRATHDLRSNLEQEVATETLRETRDSIQSVGNDLKKTLQQPLEPLGPVDLGVGPGTGCPESEAASVASPANPAVPPAPDGPQGPAAADSDVDDPQSALSSSPRKPTAAPEAVPRAPSDPDGGTRGQS